MGKRSPEWEATFTHHWEWQSQGQRDLWGPITLFCRSAEGQGNLIVHVKSLTRNPFCILCFQVSLRLREGQSFWKLCLGRASTGHHWNYSSGSRGIKLSNFPLTETAINSCPSVFNYGNFLLFLGHFPKLRVFMNFLPQSFFKKTFVKLTLKAGSTWTYVQAWELVQYGGS